MDNPTAIDLFCGAGGFSKGFADAGFSILYAVDNSLDALTTYKANHPGTVVSQSDIQSVTKKSIEHDLGFPINDLDVLIGGPPCQGFSWQRVGTDSDPRNNLVLEFLRLALEIKPRFFVIENVQAILSGRRGRIALEAVERACQSSGYSFHTKTINAKDFGVAQNRKRVFLVAGFTSGSPLTFEFSEPYTTLMKSPVTVRDAIYDLINNNGQDERDRIHASLSPRNIERLKALKEGQSRVDLPDELKLDTQFRHPNNGHRETYGRMRWDHPSPTLTTAFHSISKGRFAHPEQNRGLTLREGARLQGFPDDFIFCGRPTQISRQIGNAVPPPVAKAIARKILTHRVVSIDSDVRTVSVADRQVKLSAAEFSLFKLLFTNRHRFVTLGEIYGHHSGMFPSISSIRGAIFRIRHKLSAQAGAPFLIWTRYGGAYRLDCVAD